ncbi:M20 family metallopeptidase [Oribacterium sp. P6A1]|uniref:M20 family metallopeptidase n=1 Tax=Oribacterium sp. P6A1 TaxID=1410612 RepID=UPI0018CC6801|nr:M20 family metallopeptidase [Oribacterium sp. P6A1]
MKYEWDEADKLLTDLLNIKSVNGRDDEGQVALFLKSYFEEFGIASEIQKIDEKHSNFVAHIPGKDHSRHILLNGHMDTVPYGDLEKWKTDPGVAVLDSEGRVFARGASDMKSGLAMLAYAITHVAEKGTPSFDITFAATCDEEKGGLGANVFSGSKFLPKVTEILIGEPTYLNLGIAQKGCLWLELSFEGITGHGAYPEKGLNAIEEGMKVAGLLKEAVQAASNPVLGHSTAQVTEIEGGVAPNMTPDRCRILMDIRMVPGQTKEMVLKCLSEILEDRDKTDPRLKCHAAVKNERVSVEIGREARLTGDLKHILESHGEAPEYMGINYFTDGSAILKALPEAGVLLFGPGDPELCHQANECVELEKYHKSIAVMMDFLKGKYGN